MQNAHFLGNITIGLLPGETMSENRFSFVFVVEVEYTISCFVLCTCPKQAAVFSRRGETAMKTSIGWNLLALELAFSRAVLTPISLDLPRFDRESLTADETVSLDFRRFAFSHDQPPLQVVCGQDGYAVTSCCPSVSLY